MDEKERTSMTTDLAKLDAKLKASKAKTEEIALERANFFAQRQLWSDAMQEVYLVKNPALLISGMKIGLDAWNFVPNHPAFQQRQKSICRIATSFSGH